MKWEMEILSPPLYFSGTNWLMEESKSTKWTRAENKLFENALAVFDEKTPDRWYKVAAMIPGKTVWEVIKQYEELEIDISNIESGLIPIPGYETSEFTLEWVSSNSHDGFKHSYGFDGKRSLSSKPVDQERKKGVPWTEKEHKLFLMGLKKYGKGDWRNISRNFVVTRSPTQVASHAQKYFIRQLSGGKDKRRASIHDITIVNLNDRRTPSPDNKKLHSLEHPTVLPQQQNFAAVSGNMIFNKANGNMFISSPTFGVNSYGLKMQAQNIQRGMVLESYNGPQNSVFQMQSGSAIYMDDIKNFLLNN